MGIELNVKSLFAGVFCFEIRRFRGLAALKQILLVNAGAASGIRAAASGG